MRGILVWIALLTCWPAALLAEEVGPSPSAPSSPPLDAPADEAENVQAEKESSLDELRADVKKEVWKKGDFSITPYGILYFNTVYASQRTSPGSYTLFVHSASLEPESEFVVDARTTRLGLDVIGPSLPTFHGAQSGGRVEIDFQNSLLSTENRATLLLRHAYGEIKNEEFRLVFGQTVDVISPLMTGTLQYGAGRDVGNIGYRRAQLRVERFFALSDTFLTTAQFSINQQVFEDGNTTINGETPSWPILEGRMGWTLGPRGKEDLPWVIGLSGHIGEEQADIDGVGFNQRHRTWSGNIDLDLPLSDRFGVQAEYFVGENLGAFVGGIGQGVDPTTLRPIRSRGGWIMLRYDWTPSLHTRVGYSVDDPWNEDIVTVGKKTYNQSIFGNVSYDVTQKLMVGLEVSSWKTLYRDLLPGEAVRCEFVIKYGF